MKVQLLKIHDSFFTNVLFIKLNFTEPFAATTMVALHLQTPTMDLLTLLPLAPVALMLAAVLLPLVVNASAARLWKQFSLLSTAALLCAVAAPPLQWALPANALGSVPTQHLSWVSVSHLTAWMAVLVQLLGTVIGVYSYLSGNPRSSAGARIDGSLSLLE